MWDGGAEYRGCRRAGGRIGARRAVGGGGGAHGALARLRVDAGAVAGAASLAEVGAGDMSEATFYKHELASLGMLAGGALAWRASRRGKRWQGFAISYATGLWPWLLLSSTLGLVLSNLLWGGRSAPGKSGNRPLSPLFHCRPRRC